MRILVLSFYFEPDLGPGALRVTAISNALGTLVPNGSDVEIITTTPNRYQSIKIQAPLIEKRENLTIRRIDIPRHKGFMSQIKSFVYFSIQVLRLTKNNNYDVIVASSSRLFTAALAAFLSNRKKLNFI